MADTPSAHTIETTFGALVAGIWIQQLFCGVLYCQFRDYYHYPNSDPPFTKIIVVLLALGNLLLFVTDFLVLYRCSVTHYGDYNFFDLQSWTMWAEPGVTALVALVAQIFFLDRCRRVIVQWKWSRPVAIIVMTYLTAMVLLSCGSGLSVSGSFWRVQRFSGLALIPIPITFWLISTTVTDLSLTAVLLAALIRKKSAYGKTDTVVQKLIRLSMETSAATSLVAILNLVFYFTMMDTAYHLLPQFSISRIYTITVLATLLARREMKATLHNDALYMSSIPTKTQNRMDEITIQVSTTQEDDGLSHRDISGKSVGNWATSANTRDELYNTHSKV